MSRKTAVIAVVALAVLAGAGYWYWKTPDRVSSISASVEGRYAIVGITVPGVVKEVYVRVGEFVAQAQPLLTLDPSVYQKQLAWERMQLAELASQLPPSMLVPSPRGNALVTPGKPLAALRTEEEEARRAVEVAAHECASANLALSHIDVTAPAGYTQPDPRRQAALIARDEAAIALQKARENHEKASYARAQKEARDKLDTLNGPVSATVAARFAEYQARISRVQLAEQALAEAVILAPESGRVVHTAQPGTRVAPGDAPVSILPEKRGEWWVAAFFKKADAESFTLGQECIVALVGGSEEPVVGSVAQVATTALPDEEGEKILAVRVKLDQDALLGSLPDRPAVVSVVTGRPDPLELFWKALRK